MVVCVCNAIKERDLRDAARVGGVRCARQAYARLGAKPKCGMCMNFARNIINDDTVNA